MRAFIAKCRVLFGYAALFSFCINVLQLAMPLYFMQVFDRVMTSRSNSTLILLTLAVVGALVVMALFEWLRSRLLIRVGSVLDVLLGKVVLSELLKASARKTSDYVHSGSMRDVGVLRQFFAGTAVFAIFDAPWVPVSFAIIFMFNWLLGTIALIGVAVLFMLGVLEEKLARKALEEANEVGAIAHRFVAYSMRNAETVGALGMVGSVVGKWETLNGRMVQRQNLASTRAAGIVAISKFTRLFLQVMMMATGVFLIIDENVTPGVMLASTLILSRAMAPVEMAIASWKSLIDARDAYDRLSVLLGGAQKLSPHLRLPDPVGELSAEKLILARGQQYILKGISFNLAAGQSLGIVGPSGAGKSSLARLLVGAWPPSSGVIRLDGADISECEPDWLGKFMGYLPQDIELFPGTVADNIARLGDTLAHAEEVIEAAKKAGAHEMILRLPEGYDTPIGDSNGVMLSGGQVQRIALARALFNNPRLVVLDEPNSNLDSEGEDALLRAMRILKTEGVTVLVITHKPSLLVDFDKVMLLRDGAVEMFGPRQEVFNRLMPQQQAAPVRAV